MKKIAFIIMWTSILSFFGCGQTSIKNDNENKVVQTNKSEQYVSIECKTGDITLTLNPDQTFDLTILFWNDKTQQHTGRESINGKWSKANKVLTLITSDNNKIVYESTSTNMKIGKNEINCFTYGFKSNDKDIFASHYNLLEKDQTDKFLINATKQNWSKV